MCGPAISQSKAEGAMPAGSALRVTSCPAVKVVNTSAGAFERASKSMLPASQATGLACSTAGASKEVAKATSEWRSRRAALSSHRFERSGADDLGIHEN